MQPTWYETPGGFFGVVILGVIVLCVIWGFIEIYVPRLWAKVRSRQSVSQWESQNSEQSDHQQLQQ